MPEVCADGSAVTTQSHTSTGAPILDMGSVIHVKAREQVPGRTAVQRRLQCLCLSGEVFGRSDS